MPERIGHFMPELTGKPGFRNDDASGYRKTPGTDRINLHYPIRIRECFTARSVENIVCIYMVCNTLSNNRRQTWRGPA